MDVFCIKLRMVSLVVIWDVLSSTLLGIVLPSSDVGTDINLSVRLFLNGHPQWAMCVLLPVFMNTFLHSLRVHGWKRKTGGGTFHSFTSKFTLSFVRQGFYSCGRQIS